jgi:hypothetical protein
MTMCRRSNAVAALDSAAAVFASAGDNASVAVAAAATIAATVGIHPPRGMLPLQTPLLAMLPLALPPLLQVLGPGLSGSPQGMPLSPLLTLAHR